MNIAACFLTVALVAQAPSWATRSRIDSAYETADGRVIHALVDINGQRGTYTLYRFGVQAALSNIRYVQAMNHPIGPPKPAIVGQWTFGNQTGYFVFREPTAEGLVDGYWDFGNQIIPERVKSWDGIIQVVVVRNNEVVAEPSVERAPSLGEALPARFDGLPEAFVGEQGANAPDSWFLEAGKIGVSVGQLVTDDGSAVGVCFMVGEGIALTVKHVIASIGTRQYVARFQDPGTSTFFSFKIAGDPFLLDDIDIAVVRLAKAENRSWPPPVPLPRLNAGVRQFNFRNAQIIHFPLNQGRRTNFRGRFLDPPLQGGYRYSNETGPGTSGAPVFDFEWNLVAIHWGSERRTDGQAPTYNMGFKIDLVLAAVKRALGNTQDGQNTLKAMGL